jgi:hypothetical protein
MGWTWFYGALLAIGALILLAVLSGDDPGASVASVGAILVGAALLIIGLICLTVQQLFPG